MSHVRIAVQPIFPTNVFTTDLSFLMGDRDRLVDDVLELVADGGVPDYPGRQTLPDLHERTDDHWVRLYRCLSGVFADLGRTLRHRVTTDVVMQSWALVLDGPDSYDDESSMTHNHAAATFSSVLWLQLPESHAGWTGGGTVLLDPLAFTTRRYGSDLQHVIEPVEMGLLAFPAYLDHLPQPPTNNNPFDRPRVIVSTDCFFR